MFQKSKANNNLLESKGANILKFTLRFCAIINNNLIQLYSEFFHG